MGTSNWVRIIKPPAAQTIPVSVQFIERQRRHVETSGLEPRLTTTAQVHALRTDQTTYVHPKPAMAQHRGAGATKRARPHRHLSMDT